jgi:MOSC domain-containing protein YiiM
MTGMSPDGFASPVYAAASASPDLAAAQGRVEAIHITGSRGAPMQAIQRATALAGYGLEGDRYTRLALDGSGDVEPDRELTLIEGEAIDGLAADHGIHLEPGESRRNVTTRGIRLNDLVGLRFRIGSVECEAVALCEPCQDLVNMLGKPVLRPLVHRGGLTARILTDGDITIGDEIVPLG